MRKKILIIFKDSFPDGMASSSRVVNYAKIFYYLGYSVDIICTKATSTVNDVKFVDSIYQVPLKGRSSFRMRFFPNYEKLYDQISKLVENGPDLALIYGFPPFVQLKMLRILKGVRTVYELNEYPFSFKASKADYIPLYNWIKRQVQLYRVMPKYDYYFVISDTLCKLVKRVKPNAKVLKVPILIDKDEARSFKGKEEGNSNPYLFHAGFINEQKDDIITIFEAFAIASKQIPDLKFILTSRKGEKRTLDKIDGIIKEHNIIDNVVFTGYLDKSELWTYFDSASIAVVSKSNNIQNRYNFPTKVGEICLARVPLIYAGIGEANNYLINNVNSLIVKNHSKDISEAIIKLCNSRRLARRISNEAFNLAISHFDLEPNAKTIGEFLSEDVH